MAVRTPRELQVERFLYALQETGNADVLSDFHAVFGKIALQRQEASQQSALQRDKISGRLNESMRNRGQTRVRDGLLRGDSKSSNDRVIFRKASTARALWRRTT